jgi:hypothetical protein
MTILDFKNDYCFKVTFHNQLNINLIIITEGGIKKKLQNGYLNRRFV